jgi:hypothetical protein
MSEKPYIVRILSDFAYDDTEMFDQLEDAQEHAIMQAYPDSDPYGIWHDGELIAIVYERETFWK